MPCFFFTKFSQLVFATEVDLSYESAQSCVTTSSSIVREDLDNVACNQDYVCVLVISILVEFDSSVCYTLQHLRILIYMYTKKNSKY